MRLIFLFNFHFIIILFNDILNWLYKYNVNHKVSILIHTVSILSNNSVILWIDLIVILLNVLYWNGFSRVVRYNSCQGKQYKILQGIIHNTRRCANNDVLDLSLTDQQDSWRYYLGTCKQNIPGQNGTWLQGLQLTYRLVMLFIQCDT